MFKNLVDAVMNFGSRENSGGSSPTLAEEKVIIKVEVYPSQITEASDGTISILGGKKIPISASALFEVNTEGCAAWLDLDDFPLYANDVVTESLHKGDRLLLIACNLLKIGASPFRFEDGRSDDIWWIDNDHVKHISGNLGSRVKDND